MSADAESGQQPNPAEHNDHPEVSWWMKYLVKGIGTVSGILAMATGVWTCVSIHIVCLVAGILQCLFGFTVVVFEAPCCCAFLDFVERVGKFGDRRKFWQKGVIYIIFGIIPTLLCFGISIVPGSAGIFATGVLYGMMALGRKADRQEMLSKNKQPKDDMKMTLVANETGVSTDSQYGQGSKK